MKPKFKQKDYPPQMDNFINLWLNKYDYNSKATVIEPFTLWEKVIKDLLSTHWKNNKKETGILNDLPEDEKILLVKCLGHNIGVWDLHVYFINFRL